MARKVERGKINPDAYPIDIAALGKNTAKVILALAAAGALLSVAAVAPNLPSALMELGEIFSATPAPRRRKALRRLQERRLIEINERNGETVITLTERGRQRVLRFNLEHLCIARPERWDKKWRIIAFDIPERLADGRRALRIKIKQLGLYPLQKSVFVHPYPCKEEIDFVADFFGVGRYLNYIEADFIDDEGYLKKYFKLG